MRELRIYTGDLETDPFAANRYPKPFAGGLYTGESYSDFWGDNCLELMRTHIESLEPGIIYFHNGGRFDFFFILPWIAGNSMRVVNSRVIKSRMKCKRGWHDLRDSFAIMPIALGKMGGGKTDKRKIDIAKMERECREQHKDEIREYLKDDCVSLHERVTAFVHKFGPKLTIGGTAMKELQTFHEFACLDAPTDKDIREHYYYGGRVECFESGVVKGDLKVYDVNSMYPSVMRDALHPMGEPTEYTDTISSKTCFISVEGYNNGAFPIRTPAGLRFDIQQGIFHVTRHEYDTAVDTGLFEPTRILRCVDFDVQGTFAEFVDHYYSERIRARELDDEINAMFYKLVLNSAYGKFAQNPEHYVESIICRGGRENGPQPQCICDTATCLCGGWDVTQISTLHENELENFWVWERPASNVARFNVATGASITGASRAILLRAIASAKRPVYCDTDSIICEALPLADIDKSKLGAWKLEAEGSRMAIGGKKLYSLFDDHAERCEKREREWSEKNFVEYYDGQKCMEYDGRWQCVKKANKGVNVSAKDIRLVAQGRVVTSIRDAPSFKLDGSYRFISRKVRMTTDALTM